MVRKEGVSVHSILPWWDVGYRSDQPHLSTNIWLRAV